MCILRTGWFEDVSGEVSPQCRGCAAGAPNAFADVSAGILLGLVHSTLHSLLGTLLGVLLHHGFTDSLADLLSSGFISDPIPTASASLLSDKATALTAVLLEHVHYGHDNERLLQLRIGCGVAL